MTSSDLNPNDIVISVKNVSKKFTFIEDAPNNIKSFLINLVRGDFFRLKRSEKVVLDNVSFQVKRGEILGIMGRNGTGKSTLFRLLSGIYKPDHGEIKITEKLLPLVGLGAGFHNDLTGYENIFLNASILGFSRQSIQKMTDKIIEFADLGKHIYSPVKKYSSGMRIRLAFSVAAHIDAPIILLDEVLAVGDGGFQKKSLQKILELIHSGRTILLVSHNHEDIEKYCTRCILFEDGKISFDGKPKDAIAAYNNLFKST
jgi:ABC-type polysaccharide/polyol phosphate transport system ATPase subunit